MSAMSSTMSTGTSRNETTSPKGWKLILLAVLAVIVLFALAPSFSFHQDENNNCQGEIHWKQFSINMSTPDPCTFTSVQTLWTKLLARLVDVVDQADGASDKPLLTELFKSLGFVK